jgi:hypothetical protein
VVASEDGDPRRREAAQYVDPDEEAMRTAIERFRRAAEQGSACSDAAIVAHAEACAARARWLPRLSERISDVGRIHDERRDAFTVLAAGANRTPALVEAAEALDHAQKRLDALCHLRDDALRAESTRASMIETARAIEAAARGREWHRGDSTALPPPDDWRDVG